MQNQTNNPSRDRPVSCWYNLKPKWRTRTHSLCYWFVWNDLLILTLPHLKRFTSAPSWQSRLDVALPIWAIIYLQSSYHHRSHVAESLVWITHCQYKRSYILNQHTMIAVTWQNHSSTCRTANLSDHISSIIVPLSQSRGRITRPDVTFSIWAIIYLQSSYRHRSHVLMSRCRPERSVILIPWPTCQSIHNASANLSRKSIQN